MPTTATTETFVDRASKPRSHTLAGVLAAVLALIVTPASFAQLQGGSQRLHEPAVNAEDIEAMQTLLGLSEDQQPVLQEMHAAYVAAFTAEHEKFNELRNELVEDMRSGQDPDAFIVMLEKTTEFRRYRDRSRDAFFTDVKSLLLDEEQTEQFPRYERAWRRMHLGDVDTGALSGGAVDLVQLLNERELDDETTANLDAVIRRYERELDEIIVKRMDLADDFSEQQIELVRADPNFMAHMDDYDRMLDQTRELVLEMRDVTERYQRLFAAAMPESEREAFEIDFKRAYIPLVYDRSPADEAFETADQIESLTEEQQTKLAELQARYVREAAPINDRWAEKRLAWETESMTTMEAFGPGGPSDQELRDLATQRRELDTRFIVLVRETLDDEQREAIPDPTLRRSWRDVEFGG